MGVPMLETCSCAEGERFIRYLHESVGIPRHVTEYSRLLGNDLRHLGEHACTRGARSAPGRIAGESKYLVSDLRRVDVEAPDEKRHVDQLVIIRGAIHAGRPGGLHSGGDPP